MALPDIVLMQPVWLEDEKEIIRVFHDRQFLLEIKFDGFRSLAKYDHGHLEMRTKRGKTHQSFSDLSLALCRALGKAKISSIILDGEIVCLGEKGMPQFSTLFYRRQPVCYYVFDLLYVNDEDLRGLPLVERKRRLRGIITVLSCNEVLYAGEVLGTEDKIKMFMALCNCDLEGVILKRVDQAYDSGQYPPWWKVRNPDYSQAKNRWRLFRGKRSS